MEIPRLRSTLINIGALHPVQPRAEILLSSFRVFNFTFPISILNLPGVSGVSDVSVIQHSLKRSPLEAMK
jgi:hypothetical protein